MTDREPNKPPSDNKPARFWARGAEATKQKVFDYRALRFLLGLAALSVTWVVTFTANETLVSISSSYHTDARDCFVGLLFFVGAFLWAYNGHYRWEGRLSKLAGVAAIVVALVPGACPGCEKGIEASVHLAASATLFLVLAYFCLVPFRKNTKGKGGKKRLRSGIYLACGVAILGALGIASILTWTLCSATVDEYRIVYWGEAIALHAFGIAWMTAGKVFPFLVDKEEAVSLLGGN
ncbi:MAG: hypothetical protein JKY56_13750 [Kofleriaceae bacterium]|nr:hypothetical protein [Kofleriaceae bacterium]